MPHQRLTSRFLFLVASLAACLVLAACGDDDTSDAESNTPDESPADTSAEAPDDSEDAGDDSSDGANEDADEESAAGTISVDGVSYSFSPDVCLPDQTAGSSVTGSGAAEDGTEVYVDMAAGNLSVYLGADDPLSADPDFVASSVAGQGALDETVDGSTVSAEASFTEHAGMDVVAEGSLEVTC